RTGLSSPRRSGYAPWTLPERLASTRLSLDPGQASDEHSRLGGGLAISIGRRLLEDPDRLGNGGDLPSVAPRNFAGDSATDSPETCPRSGSTEAGHGPVSRRCYPSARLRQCAHWPLLAED